MENYPITAGSSLTLDVTLRDAGGIVVADYDGTQTLTTQVWPGGERAVAFNPATTWDDPTAGTVSIAITAADTADLAAGRYQLLSRLTDGAITADIYRCTLEIEAVAAAGADPKVYCEYADLFKYGGAWLRQLATDDDEAGFVEDRARARSWIEDLGQARYQGDYLNLGQPYGTAPNPQLAAWFAADKLIVTPAVVETCAHKALAFICRRQIGTGDGAGVYLALARLHESEADIRALGMSLGIDTAGNGTAALAIDLGVIRPLYG